MSTAATADSPIIEVMPPAVAEMRGLRLRLPAAPTPEEIDALAGRCAEAGVNFLIVRVYRRGTTLWPSDAAVQWHLPRVRHRLGGRDILAELGRACQREGIALGAWLDLLPALDRAHERRTPLTRRHRGWCMRTRAGALFTDGPDGDLAFLCPAHDEVRRFLGDICCELVTRYPIASLWLEEMRYPVGAESAVCLCPICRARVRTELNLDLDDPALEDDAAAQRTWTQWREARLSDLLESLLARVRKARGGVLTMGRVPAGASPEAAERPHRMDWARWVREGKLDLASPAWVNSLGDLSAEEKLDVLRRDFEAVAPVGRLAPMLPLSDLRAENAPLLAGARALALSGHVWDAAPEPPTDDDWAAMRRGHGDDRALVPEIDPLDSMRAVTEETATCATADSDLAAFLADLLGVLQTGYGQFSDAQMGDLLDNLERAEAKARRGEIPLTDPERVTRNLNWLRRQLVFLRGRQLLTHGL